VLVAVALFWAVALVAQPWHTAIAAEPLRSITRFDGALVDHGARLAALGNCASCHTAQDGPPYAGGVPLTTPFGTIYGTNVTPDPETGIGNWSEAAFKRAMRKGIAQDGRFLYPAFPYDHFTHATNDDLNALYAFLMTRQPVQSRPPANQLYFPFTVRESVAVWNLLFLRNEPFRPDPAQGVEWNRGAYLVQSLGHCGSCHTPRNALGGEQRRAALQGGEAEGWYAPALDAQSPSPLPWTVGQLTDYLRTGIASDHAIAGGPMQEVVASLGQASAEDIRAIAVYVTALMASSPDGNQSRATATRRRAAQPLANILPAANDAQMRLGAAVYAESCAACHDQGRLSSSNSALQLPLAAAVYEPDPRNLIHIVREGISPVEGMPGRWMPAFGGSLTDEQLTALAIYLRRYAANASPWLHVEKVVKETKK